MARKLRVGILGATGTVGQKFIVLLQNHPWFEITALGASANSAGKSYYRAVENRWKQSIDIPQSVANIIVQDCDPTDINADFVFSGLDSSVAGPIEERFAELVFPVISNARNHRMDDDVPLLIPEVNDSHLGLIDVQRKKRGWMGFIVTNPNCVAIPLSLVLKPISDNFGIEKVVLVTMQAVSGAGYPGIPSLDIMDNVLPQIDGEESKVELEPKKILGRFDGKKVNFYDFRISSQCNRVAVSDGHLIDIFFSTSKETRVEKIKEVLKKFKAEPQKLNLPSAPKNPIIYLENDFRPQPKLDRDNGNGMAITVGRLRECPVFGYKMTVLGHNTIRGAAGAAILNAELLYKKGYLK